MQLSQLCGDSIHTQRPKTFQDSDKRIKRLLAEKRFLRWEYPSKEELVSPSHLSPVSSTSSFPELKPKVTITISVKGKYYVPNNKHN